MSEQRSNLHGDFVFFWINPLIILSNKLGADWLPKGFGDKLFFSGCPRAGPFTGSSKPLRPVHIADMLTCLQDEHPEGSLSGPTPGFSGVVMRLREFGITA